MKVLVTGAGGYIGTTLVRVLLKNDFEVVALDRFHFGEGLLPVNDRLTIVKADIRNVDISIFNEVDAVIDLAAISNDPSGELDPTTTVSINHLGRLRIASLSKASGVKRYILPSSASVYGFSNEVSDENSHTNPLTTYAEANLLAEKDILALASDEFVVTVLRQATVFGLSYRMRFDLAINGMTKGFLQNGKIPILRDGTQWRPFIHVKDTCKAMMTVLMSSSEKVQGQIFNVGSNQQNYQILTAAKEVAEAINRSFEYEWYGDPDHRSYRLDFAKIKNTIDFSPDLSLSDGAKEIDKAIQLGDIDIDNPKSITLKWYKKLMDDGVKL
ncbi:MAG: NAD-dependent dehydratase [Flammeovirgaceae bacterium]|nr:NAD-dependent dehydratase [Flammeovirgaceae bacterium]|tara:strand:+ start:663 stop:1646 length:984 start_codon:yes stop_codon:yes gene_type:complete